MKIYIFTDCGYSKSIPDSNVLSYYQIVWKFVKSSLHLDYADIYVFMESLNLQKRVIGFIRCLIWFDNIFKAIAYIRSKLD